MVAVFFAERRPNRAQVARAAQAGFSGAMIDTARKDLKSAQGAQENKAAELKVAMADAWRTVLEEPVSVARAAAQAPSTPVPSPTTP